jgi:hypothetical protein
MPYNSKCSYTYVKLMHQFAQLPEFLILDFSNCLFVKPEEVKHSNFELLLAMQEDISNPDTVLPGPGACCFMIDLEKSILRAIVLIIYLV